MPLNLKLCPPHYKILEPVLSKSTTNRSNRVWALRHN